MSPSIIPFSGDIPQEKVVVKVDQNSRYPDPGVRWAGFYKVRSTGAQGGEWILKPQIRFMMNFGASTGALVPFGTADPCYVTGFSYSWTGVIMNSLARITLQDRDLTTTAPFWEMVSDSGGAPTEQPLAFVTFDPPLFFPNGGEVSNGWGTVTNGAVEANVWGWNEPVS